MSVSVQRRFIVRMAVMGEQMDDFLHNCPGLPHYDRVAIPGGAACLAGHMLAMQERWGDGSWQLKFLIEAHGLS